MRLQTAARAALANELLESLADEDLDADVDAEWTAELERRVDDVESGRVQCEPWWVVHSRLDEAISRSRGR